MFYFKDQSGHVHILDDLAYEYLLPPGCVQITKAQADNILANSVFPWSPINQV